MKKVPSSTLHTLFCFAFLLAPFASFGQFALKKGYYINKSDSSRVAGYFDFSLIEFNTINYFTAENLNTPTKLSPGDVWVIAGDDGALALPVAIKHKEGVIEIFANRILDAEVSLFEGWLNENEALYFVRTTSRPKLMKINKNAPDLFLKTYLSGNCAPKNKIKYTKYDLITALKAYSNCIGNGFKESEKKRFVLNFSFGVRAGLAFSQPKVSGFYANLLDQSNGPALGADVQMTLNRRLSIRIGFAYVHTTLLKPAGKAIDYTFRGWPFKLSEPIQFSYDTYELPLEIVWMFNKNKRFSPFVGAGVSIFKTSSPKYEKQFTEPDNFNHGFYSFTAADVVSSLDGDLTPISNFNFAGQLKTGFILRFKNDTFLELELRYKSQKVDYAFDNQITGLPITIANRRWLDFSLAFYIPLTHKKTLVK